MVRRSEDTVRSHVRSRRVGQAIGWLARRPNRTNRLGLRRCTRGAHASHLGVVVFDDVWHKIHKRTARNGNPRRLSAKPYDMDSIGESTFIYFQMTNLHGNTIDYSLNSWFHVLTPMQITMLAPTCEK